MWLIARAIQHILNLMTVSFWICIGFAGHKPRLLVIGLGFTDELSHVFGIPRPKQAKRKRKSSQRQIVHVWGDACATGLGGFSMSVDMLTVKPHSHQVFMDAHNAQSEPQINTNDSVLMEIMSAKHCIETVLSRSGNSLRNGTLVYHGDNQQAILWLSTKGADKCFKSKRADLRHEVLQIHSMALEADVDLVFQWCPSTKTAMKLADRLSRLATRARIVGNDLKDNAPYVKEKFPLALVL